MITYAFSQKIFNNEIDAYIIVNNISPLKYKIFDEYGREFNLSGVNFYDKVKIIDTINKRYIFR